MLKRVSVSTLPSVSRLLTTMTTDFRPGHLWISCSQSMSWKTVIVRVSIRPWSRSTVRVPADRGLFERDRFLLAGEEFDVVAQRALGTLQRENVIGLLVEDFLSEFRAGSPWRRWSPPRLRWPTDRAAREWRRSRWT